MCYSRKTSDPYLLIHFIFSVEICHQDETPERLLPLEVNG